MTRSTPASPAVYAQPLRLTAAWTAIVCAALTLASAPLRASDARELSSEEAADLRAGKLVTRPLEKLSHGRQLIGGMAWQLIEANVDTVFAALTDEHAHVKYLPAAEDVRKVEAGPPAILFVQHRLGLIRAGYFVRANVDPSSHSLRLYLDRSRPSSIRDAWAELRGAQKCCLPDRDGGPRRQPGDPHDPGQHSHLDVARARAAQASRRGLAQQAVKQTATSSRLGTHRLP
jgi:hypothetical protein